jgi:hypothetical protein
MLPSLTKPTSHLKHKPATYTYITDLLRNDPLLTITYKILLRSLRFMHRPLFFIGSSPPMVSKIINFDCSTAGAMMSINAHRCNQPPTSTAESKIMTLGYAATE